MAASLNASVRPETLLLGGSSLPQRTLTVPWACSPAAAASSLYNFTLQSVGGVIFLQEYVPGAQSERGLHWQIENSTTSTLHFTEFTVHGGTIGSRTTVELPFQLFPALAATGTSDGRLILAALLSNKYLLHLELRVSSGGEGTLTSLSAASLRPLDLSQQLAPLGTPMSLAATQDAIVIGGSNGSVLCVPLSSLADSNTARCFELRDSSWALSKLIPGVLYRPRQPAALACVPVTVARRQLLFVSYDDCVLRVFSVGKRQQLAALELETPGAGQHAAHGSSARHLVPTYVNAESLEAASSYGQANGHGGSDAADGVALVVQFEAAETLQRHTYLYTVSVSAAGRLAVASVTALAVEAGAVVAEARVSRDTVWLLARAQGKAKVLGYDRARGSLVSGAVLAEAAGEPAGVGGAANGPEVDQELWEWLLAAFPGVVTAESQVCQQVLVPGQLCRASLRDALSYHGAQYGTAEVDAAPYAVLRSWMQAAVLAIQRRSPSASPAECWQSLLATYRSSWSRRHPPLSLVLHRASPDWLGLARGGGVLCVLRRGTGVEALHGAEVVGSLELGLTLNAVHRCAAEAGALLGPLAGEACLALMAAGVDPLEQLLPRLCELWLNGPVATPAAGGSFAAGGVSAGGASAVSGRAAALTDAAREAQARWRQRRQQQWLAIQQQIGAVAGQGVKSIWGYIHLLKLLTSQVAAELSSVPPSTTYSASVGAAAAAATPSRATAAFLVATCRQVSRAAAIAARDFALLMGLLMQLDVGSRGSHDYIERRLLPEACDVLRRAALGLWLSGTPAAAQGDAPDMEPALSALRHLRLGSPPAKRAHADGPGAPADSALTAATANGNAGGSGGAAGDASLAARLLPNFLASYGSTATGGRRLDLLTGAEAAGLLYTLYLQYGEQPSASMAARVLQLGCRLFQVGEYGSLAELSSLAGATGGAEAGPQFLRGLGITCALALERQQAGQQRGGGGGASSAAAGAAGSREVALGGGLAGLSRSDLIAEAAGCFFRASASLPSEAGASLRAMLHDMREELAGGEAGAAPSLPNGLAAPPAAAAAAAGSQQQHHQHQQQRREVALLQLHFCEAVMQLFEREGAPEGAALFAAAALEHLRTAYGSSSEPAAASATRGDAGALSLLPGEERVEAAAAEAEVQQRAAREGRLWSNIYSYSVEMRQYDRAYAALLANPLPAARLQSLRHLVHAMTQDRQLQMLCSLPYAGVAVVPATDAPASSSAAAGPGPAPGRAVSLLGEALEVLHRRAHNCDLAEQPQPYQVLYDFLVCRGDYRGAARAMAAYAWRLRAEAPSTAEAVAEALRAYDLAIHCLSLLEPQDAWLDLTDPWVAKIAPHGQQQHAHVSAGGDAAAADGAAAGGGSGVSSAAPVATIRSLQRERTMLHFCATVAARVAGLEPMRQWDNEEAILHQLLIMGRYGGALTLVADCYGYGCAAGQPYGTARGPAGAGAGDAAVRALESVVAALATHCARLQLQDGGIPTGGPPLPPTDLFSDDPDGGGDPQGGAAGLGLGFGLGPGAAAVAGTLGGRAGALWCKLRQLLVQVAAADAAAEQQLGAAEAGGAAAGGRRVGWLLRDAAAEAVLRTDPRIDLPQWLLDMFLLPAPGTSPTPCGMGAHACGPASLLALYLRHDRLAAAVEAVAGAVAEWGRADVRLRRRHSAAWMPYPQLELLRTKLTIACELGAAGPGGATLGGGQAAALLRTLNAAVKTHLDLVATDTERLAEQVQQQQGQGQGLGQLGAGQGPSGGFGFGLLMGGGAGVGAMDVGGSGGQGAPLLSLLGAAASPMTPMGQGFGFGGVGAATGGVRLFG